MRKPPRFKHLQGYDFGNVRFSTLIQAEKAVEGALAAFDVVDLPVEIHPGDPDYDLYLAVAIRHVRGIDIIKDISHFRVERRRGRHRGLVAISKTGERRAFLWRAGIHRESRETAIGIAMRSCVSTQMYDARMRWVWGLREDETSICEWCGRPFLRKDLEVDHYPLAFASIRDGFLQGKNPMEVLDAIREDHQPEYDSYGLGRFEADWLEYHKARASYVLSCHGCNAHGNAISQTDRKPPKYKAKVRWTEADCQEINMDLYFPPEGVAMTEEEMDRALEMLEEGPTSKEMPKESQASKEPQWKEEGEDVDSLIAAMGGDSESEIDDLIKSL